MSHRKRPDISRPLDALAARVPRGVSRSLRLRRVAHRMGIDSAAPHERRPPERPLGVKLELTYRCNLRCSFCYTDSPRRTLEGTVDLPDAAWERITAEALELGVIEAVITGGEPLLRPELALGTAERLAAAGVAVSFNTNGWFVDDEVAERFAAAPGLRVHVSIDGASAEVHDEGRGVPGSWDRAVRAVDRLLARGVPCMVPTVVTPASIASLPEFLEHMWALGVPLVTLTPIVPVGAAAASEDWAVGRAAIESAVSRFRSARGTQMGVRVQTGGMEQLARGVAPRSLLVRPNGGVRADSLNPFSFGTAQEGLAACWQRLREHWDGAEIEAWRRGIDRPEDLHSARLVPYRDEEVPVPGAPVAATEGRPRRGGKLLAPPAPRSGPPADLGAARSRVAELALARPYALNRVRATGDPGGVRYVRVVDRGTAHRLNPTAAAVMDACAGGSPADAVARLGQAHPRVGAERIADDVLAAVRTLTESGVLRPALARRGPEPVEGPAPDLPGVDPVSV